MGSIIFNGKTIYKGPLASWTLNPNWCDSMAEYYPYIFVEYVDGGGEIRQKKVAVDERLSENYSAYTVEFDKTQSEEHAAIHRRRQLEAVAKEINYHKVVKVIRGRKVPIGTVGEVMWMGNSGYGESVGLRLLDGKVVFTAKRNVEVVSLDTAFEQEVLGLKKD